MTARTESWRIFAIAVYQSVYCVKPLAQLRRALHGAGVPHKFNSLRGRSSFENRRHPACGYEFQNSSSFIYSTSCTAGHITGGAKRNITGFTTISPVIAGKRLELLKEIVPKLSRVAVLWTAGQADQSWEESQLAGRRLGLQIHSMELNSTDQFGNAFKEAINAGSDALAVTPNSLTNSNRKLIAELAAQNRLPVIYSRRIL